MTIPPDTPRDIGPPNTSSDILHELPQPCPVYTDELSAAVFDDAVATLGIIRGLAWLGDPAAELHLLACLTAQAPQALPNLIAACREQDMSWDDIATTGGISPDIARRLAPVGAAARRETLLLD